jgi:hypothetical protein
VRRPHVDTSGSIVDVDPDAGELARTASRPLHGIDRHIVSRSTGDDNVPGQVDDAEPAVASNLDPPRKALGLFRSAATLIRRPFGPLDGPLHRALDGLLNPVDCLLRRLRLRGRGACDRAPAESLSRMSLPRFNREMACAAPASSPVRMSLMSAMVFCSSSILALKLVEQTAPRRVARRLRVQGGGSRDRLVNHPMFSCSVAAVLRVERPFPRWRSAPAR